MEAKQIWQAALERVRRRISPGAFSTWFSGTSGVELERRRLTVAAPSTFAAEHLRQRFAEMARIAVSEVIGESAEIAFIVREPVQPAPPGPRTAPARGNRRGSTKAGASGPTSRTRQPQLAQQVALVPEARPAPPPASTRSRGGRRPASMMQPPLVPPTPPAPLRPIRGATTPVASDGAPAYPSEPAVPAAVPVTRAPVTPTALALARSEPDAAGSMYELHPRYVFETYVVGTANRLAYAAAQEVATYPGERYNPLFLYGGVGLGKTHLLHAIGHKARASGLHVAYVTAERFTNEIIEAIRMRTTEFFRARYRAVDVLLVDDVQFIAGKESTEEEFFHTFNALHDINKQIVLSSDRVPHAMAHLHDRLRSRFQWGLMADIHAPDYPQRVEILRTKAAERHIEIPDDVVVRLAQPECENIRTLEGALNRVVAYAKMLNAPLDLRLVESALTPLAGEAPTRQMDAGAVLDAVARHFGVQLDDLRGKSRERGIAWARQVAMFLLREETPASLLQIGQLLGGRDHTTVMHGCSRVGKSLAADERVRREINAIRASLHG